MEIQITGRVTITDGDHELAESALPGRQARIILAALALHGSPVHRDALAEAVWPEALPATWERTLSGVVSRLRTAIDRAGLEGLTIANAFGCYELHSPPGARLDIDVARAEAGAAERALAVGDLAAARTSAAAAAEVARREFLAGEEGEWIEALRVELRTLLARALATEAAATLGSIRAVDAAKEAVEVDPFSEKPYVLLMRAHAAVGGVAEALLAYERCWDVLVTELGIEPSEDARALHTALVQAETDAAVERLSGEGLLTLPPKVTTFVGRGNVLETILELLTSKRLVTLTGPGGVGKTRLAVEAARSSVGTFRDGVHLIDLAAAGPSTALPEYAATQLGLTLRTSTPEALASILDTQLILVVFDNCEHILDAVAMFVRALLGNTKSPVVLATSREALSLPDEAVLDVPPLDVPSPGSEMSKIVVTDSVALFRDRASEARGGFELSPSNVDAVAEICRGLDGMPLAIELAAASVSTMSIAEISEKLGEIVASGRIPRHRTLHAVIDWSYDLLKSTEARCFRQVASFEGPFSQQDAAAVCGGDVTAELDALVRRSIVQATADGRYRLLETIKQYARERVGGTREWDDALARHIEHYAAFLTDLAASSDQAGHLSGVGAVYADASAALDRALELDRITEACALAEAQWRFWLARGLLVRGRSGLEQTIERAPADAAVPLVFGLGTIVFNTGEFATAQRLWLQALEDAEDEAQRAPILAALASVAFATGRDDEAIERARQTIASADAGGHDQAAGLAYLQLFGTAYQQRAFEEAASYAERALERFTRSGSQTGIARALISRSADKDLHGEDRCELIEQAVDVCRQIDDKLTLGIALLQLGVTLTENGRHAEAIDTFREGLRLTWRIGDRRAFLNCVEQIACVAAENESPDAHALFTAVDARREELQIAQSYMDHAGRLDRLKAKAQDLASSPDKGDPPLEDLLERAATVLDRLSSEPATRSGLPAS